MNTAKDEGSILVLGIGLLLVAVMVATTVVNVAGLWVTRAALNSVADGAALAGAQAIDLDDMYRTGVPQYLRLDPGEARSRIRAFVAHEQGTVPGLAIRSMEVRGDEVAVTLTAPPHPAFGYLMPVRPTVVAAAAHAVNRVQ